MPPKKTPTSSLPVIELLFKRALYRTLAGIRKVRSGGISLQTSTTHNSPATKLPLEIVEKIMAYLFNDKRSLLACTMTCYSWYIAAAPRLHYTLTVDIGFRCTSKFEWPNPIPYMHMLGLLPLVREFRIIGNEHSKLRPKQFNCCILHQLSALSNVHDLEIQYLDIPKFMPRIKQYFRNFLPTVRSLSLREPRGSSRQVIYFIGLFQHLQDLELLYNSYGSRADPIGGDLTLIPAFVPPLRGWLKLSFFRKIGLLEDMIHLFGGLRFRYIYLYDVAGMPLLLRACAKTLEVVVLHSTDPRAESSLLDFNLSRNKSLRTLRIQGSPSPVPRGDSSDTAPGLLNHVLSTITSPAFFRLTVIYGDHDFRGIELGHPTGGVFLGLSQAERAGEVARIRKQFKVFREARKVRDFELELCVCTWGSVGEEPVRILEEAVAEEKAENGFFFDPYVEYYPKWSRPGH